jgi:hypothetical protein
MITGKSKKTVGRPRKQKVLYALMTAEQVKNPSNEGTYVGKAYDNYQHPVNSYLKHSKSGDDHISKMVVVKIEVIGKPNVTRRITLK